MIVGVYGAGWCVWCWLVCMMMVGVYNEIGVYVSLVGVQGDGR